MVMGLVQDEDMEWVINNSVSFFDKPLDKAAKTAKKLDKKALNITEVDWMNRTGFEKKRTEYRNCFS
jgi:alanine racemase